MSRDKIDDYFIPRKFLNQESFEIVNFEDEKNNICLIKTKYNDMNIIHILINFYSH